MLYWKVGSRINANILKDKRAEYGKEVIASLAEQLTAAYGKGWDVKTLRHCLRAAETVTSNGSDLFDVMLEAFHKATENETDIHIVNL